MMRLLRLIVLLLSFPLIPVCLAVSAVVLALTDLFFRIAGKRHLIQATAPRRDAVTVVIPNWNGRDLLEKFLPSVVTALAGNPDHEIIVVDNASTDGSVVFLREQFPQIRVLAQERNLGFGGGSNAGFQAAKNDIVVLLNNDMRVQPDFLAPLLEPFSDRLVFSVSCQIFFSDLQKRREETGLSEVWWENGRLKASHRADAHVRIPYPCAYPGGGSSAFDRRKFLELGGFDELLRPFYYEDTALGFMAWKRGWKLLYQPTSVVYHEHRGTIGKKFSKSYIEGVLKKNVVLYCWKNIHDWGMLRSHFWACFTTSASALVSGRADGKYTTAGIFRAFLQIGEAVQARWRAKSLSAISDVEAFRRPLGGYYRDCFEAAGEPVPERLRVLFASPYPIEPPIHGGAVFMKQTLEALTPIADVHLVCFLDRDSQLEQQQPMRDLCAGASFLVRNVRPPKNPSTLLPHSIREFADRDFAWLIHRTIYLEHIDVVQLEYTILGQYAGEYRRIPCILFEHDVAFQSLWRGRKALQGARQKAIAMLEYVRTLRYELNLLSRVTRVQMCSRENAAHVLEYVPYLKDRVDDELRAAIDTSRYRYVVEPREPDTILFVGSFQHLPNREALSWFTGEVLPQIVARRPQVTFVVVGSDPPPALRYLTEHPNIRLTGFVEDIREPLERYAVFACPILSGSGVRVKLLEAFASGIPVVSTTMGAEGLASESGKTCELADTPHAFAEAILGVLSNRHSAMQLAQRARETVVREKDSRTLTARMEGVYRTEVERCRSKAISSSGRVLVGEGISS